MIDPRAYDLLNNSDTNQRKQGISLLVDSGDPEALYVLQDILQRDPDPDVRDEARRAEAYLRGQLSQPLPAVQQRGGLAMGLMTFIVMMLGALMISGIFLNWVDFEGFSGTGWEIVDTAFEVNETDVMNYSPLLLPLMGVLVILVGTMSLINRHAIITLLWVFGLIATLVGAVPLAWFYTELSDTLEGAPVDINDLLDIGFWACCAVVGVLGVLSLVGLVSLRPRTTG